MLKILLLAAVVFAAASPEEEINTLVSQGKYEFRSCNKFKKKWKGVVKGGLTLESASHVSREHALEVLKLLEKSPGWAPSFAKAKTIFLEKHAELEALPDQNALMEKLGAIVDGDCEMFSQMIHLSILFKDIKAHSLNKKDTARVHRLAQRVLSSRPLLAFVEAGVKSTILLKYLEEAYAGENKDALLIRVKAFQTDFEAKRELARAEQAKINLTDKKGTLASFGPDLNATVELGKVFSAIVADVSFN